MFRRTYTILLTSLLCSAVVEAQWQPCQPGASLCQTAGNVGIGTTSPSQALDVNGNVVAKSFGMGGPTPNGYQFFATTSTNGTSSGLQLRSNFTGSAVTYMGNYGNYGTILSQNRDPRDGTFVEAAVSPNQGNAAHLMLGDTMRNRLLQVSNWPNGQETVRLFVDYDGNVGIGEPIAFPVRERLNVDGNIKVTGNINAKYQDVAEWVEAPAKLAPGTVVVLDPARNNAVIASTAAYDTSAAGVVSAQPGISLGERSESKIQVATTGRVRVKVDANRGAIRIGDLLVTSDMPGTAMKSAPVNVAGIAMHRPGSIIGKALEPLEKGHGEILVLLSLQ